MEGQLNQKERDIITERVTVLKPNRALEVGTWMGGGSTLHILKALEGNGHGHLWGIEASESIYQKMIANIASAGTNLEKRFSPIFGFSQKVIPAFLADQENNKPIDFTFLDGGDNPMEQVEEFQLLRGSVPVGGVMLFHDAKLRKGKWLVPYLKAHDNWDCTLHDVSDEGLFEARKIAAQPTERSRQLASTTLRKLRLQPKEFLGRNIPTSVINIILKFLPRRMLLSITQDRS